MIQQAPKTYDPVELEKRIQEYWIENDSYRKTKDLRKDVPVKGSRNGPVHSLTSPRIFAWPGPVQSRRHSPYEVWWLWLRSEGTNPELSVRDRGGEVRHRRRHLVDHVPEGDERAG